MRRLKYLFLVLVLCNMCGCAAIASKLPEISQEQAQSIAEMIAGKVNTEISSHGEGKDNPYLPIGGGAMAATAALAIIGLYNKLRKKYAILKTDDYEIES